MNAGIAKPIPQFWFIQRRVVDPAQTLAAARAVIGGVLTIVSVTIARQWSATIRDAPGNHHISCATHNSRT